MTRTPRGRSTWLAVARFLQMIVGLIIYGLSSALLVRGALGLDPWDVFHQGLARHLHWALGTVVIVVGAALLLLWIPLRERPGIGTLSNTILVGLSLNWWLQVLPPVSGSVSRIGLMLAGVLVCGVATGMYIAVGLGPGPRDGLMTGLSRRTGWSIRATRTGLELLVLGCGWLLGGSVGIGTLVYALGIGPASQIALSRCERLPTAPAQVRAERPARIKRWRLGPR